MYSSIIFTLFFFFLVVSRANTQIYQSRCTCYKLAQVFAACSALGYPFSNVEREKEREGGGERERLQRFYIHFGSAELTHSYGQLRKIVAGT
jgi:hypothetical protein